MNTTDPKKENAAKKISRNNATMKSKNKNIAKAMNTMTNEDDEHNVDEEEDDEEEDAV